MKHFLIAIITIRYLIIIQTSLKLNNQVIQVTWIMNNASLESYYIVVFKYLAIDYLSCNIFADASSFSSISGKIRHVASLNHIQPHLMFLVYLLATNVLSVCRYFKKLKNEGSTMFRGSAVQKLEEKCFSVRIWTIVK